ncbi:hybrid sensor histidine kinase/response regulator [Fibrella forsythiae]|uniref:histidine kinase n=1 Tax=Fibrella forsythiae TaxID=2817061 RepID=A0ABS3JVK7_9BACT|nr:ATP-binding protein [Fibrella forsythiae]MBO0952952.1 response regulator [Fibrella forsythiae]
MPTDYTPLEPDEFNEFYQVGFRAMNQGFCLLEKVDTSPGEATDFRYLLVNPAFEQRSGLHQVMGKRLRDVVPGIEEHIVAYYDQVALTGEPVEFETYVATLKAWISAYAFCIRQQQPARIAVLFTNITARKRAEKALGQREQRQAFLLRLSDALGSLADPVAIQATVTRMSMDYLETDRSYYCEIEGDQVTIRRDAYRAGLASVAAVYSLSHLPLFKALSQAGRPIVVEDVTTTNLFDEALKQLCLKFGILSCLNVPVLKQGQLIGNFCLAQRAPRQWTILDTELAQELAQRTWAAIEQARAEMALRESENHFRLTIEAARVGTWDWNLMTDEVVWNEQHFWLFGMEPRPGPVSPSVYMDHVHPDERERIGQLLQAAIDSLGIFDTEFCAVLEDGSQRWMSGYGRVVETIQGRATRMSGVMFDVDKRRRAEDALRQADRRKDEFLALLAHELRNPMATLSSTLRLLEVTGGQHPSLPLSMAIALMQREVTHLVRLVDDLLDVSRISQGKMLLSIERLDLASLVGQVLQTARSEFTTASLSLTISLPEGPLYLAGDAARLRQVVSNLLHNALKFTPPGGQVWLSLDRLATEAALRVRDTGVGIPAHELGRIFEMFAQVDTSLGRSQDGLGLGLTLVHELVSLHGGRVEAFSAGMSEGSEFVVFLPLLPVSAETVTAVSTLELIKSAVHRLLLIDDNADAVLSLSLLLELEGYEVTTATSGEEGIQIAGALKPTVILCDISMPGMDGYQTCQHIRQQSWGKSLFMIALTGYGQEDDKRRTREAGFNAHLVKPVDIADLSTLLSELPLPT